MMRPKDEIVALTMAALDAQYDGDDARLKEVLAAISADSIDDVRGSVALVAGYALNSVLPPPGADHAAFLFDVGFTDRPQTPVSSFIAALFTCVERVDAEGLTALYETASAEELAEVHLLLIGFVNDARVRMEGAEQS